MSSVDPLLMRVWCGQKRVGGEWDPYWPVLDVGVSTVLVNNQFLQTISSFFHTAHRHYNTRNCNVPKIHMHTSKLYNNSFMTESSILWTRLPETIKTSKSFNIFTQHFIKYKLSFHWYTILLEYVIHSQHISLAHYFAITFSYFIILRTCYIYKFLNPLHPSFSTSITK